MTHGGRRQRRAFIGARRPASPRVAGHLVFVSMTLRPQPPATSRPARRPPCGLFQQRLPVSQRADPQELGYPDWSCTTWFFALARRDSGPHRRKRNREVWKAGTSGRAEAPRAGPILTERWTRLIHHILRRRGVRAGRPISQNAGFANAISDSKRRGALRRGAARGPRRPLRSRWRASQDWPCGRAHRQHFAAAAPPTSGRARSLRSSVERVRAAVLRRTRAARRRPKKMRGSERGARAARRLQLRDHHCCSLLALAPISIPARLRSRPRSHEYRLYSRISRSVIRDPPRGADGSPILSARAQPERQAAEPIRPPASAAMGPLCGYCRPIKPASASEHVPS